MDALLEKSILEFIGTFVLVLFGDGVCCACFGGGADGMGLLPITWVITALGMSLGATTGYAMNAARDLSPRIAHAILPIKDKGSSDWGYSWIPVVAPIAGAICAALFYGAIAFCYAV